MVYPYLIDVLVQDVGNIKTKTLQYLVIAKDMITAIQILELGKDEKIESVKALNYFVFPQPKDEPDATSH